MTEQQRAQRNLNPHKAAVMAMYIWGYRYSQQHGGSMDFWDSLSASEKRVCRDAVEKVERAGREVTDGD